MFASSIFDQGAQGLASLQSKLIQNCPNTFPLPRTLVHILYRNHSFLEQARNHASAVCKAPSTLHVADCIPLDGIVSRLLLQDVDQLEILRVRADAVNDWEGEFALGQVFAKTFVLSVVSAVQVQVVVADLENEANEIDEVNTVSGDRNLVGVYT